MTDVTFEEKLRIEDEAIAVARQVGAKAYADALKTGVAAICPYDPDKSGDYLDDVRMTAWFDGIAFAQAQHEGPAFVTLGTPAAVKLEVVHSDGSSTYSIPAPHSAD
ncbi:hypothetical protein [Herbaspirillum huttiense]|uniref:hypothetical protein n=1 Tax=Herbaspirillum huttiense TaxID=863372 RepID=UPI0039B02935